MGSVVLRNVVKRYGELQVVHGIDLEIGETELVVLVGPSGCGKSTLLRMIAGLEDISGGEVEIGGRIVNTLPPRHRDIAMVFQDYALYPHMSVRDNMGFGLKMRGVERNEIERRVIGAAEILQITHLLDRKPRQLSGGQRQRVAMGRAIVRSPVAFLFDEPLSNLDAKLRTEMRTEIKKLHDRLRTTIIYVTHDQVEAMTLADRIVVLRGGRIEQVGSPHQIYNEPANRFVAGFTGSPPMNFVPCRLEATGNAAAIVFQAGRLPISPARFAGLRAHAGRDLVFGIRPEHLRVSGPGDPPDCRLGLSVQVVEPLGSDTLAVLGLDGHDIVARLPPEAAPRPGDRLDIAFATDRFHLFDPRSEERITNESKT